MSLLAPVPQLANNLMMTNRKLNLHYLGLTFLISLAIFLRFWNLELKPLWMDEVITAIFSLGKNYSSIPLDILFPLEKLRDVFSYQPGVSCPQIAHNLATESTHPPLFFCGMYGFLGWFTPLGDDWVNKLRSLSVLFGVALVVTVYFLNRLAFSRQAGLMGAAFVAVSPFAVYLSQEARHYTLPMLAISLSLLALIQIQQDIFQRQQVRFWLWLIWIVINSIAIYIHYFCIIAFIAQIATLILLISLFSYSKNLNLQPLPLQKRNLFRSVTSGVKFRNAGTLWLALIFATNAVVVSLVPWLGILQNHLNRSETSWLPTPQHIEPLYQTLISWAVMVIILPIERQPLVIQIISGLLMLLFIIWLGWKVFRGIKLLLQSPATHLSTLTLLSFTTLVLIGILMISYILGKDITVAPRYNFVYYPSFSALIAASLIRENSSSRTLISDDSSNKPDISKFRNISLAIILTAGLISSIVVVSDLAFQKAYLPQKEVAQKIYQEPSIPIMAVMAYSNYQDIALGLSFALALERENKILENQKNNLVHSQDSHQYSKFAFFNQTSGWQSVFDTLSQLPKQNISQLNLWIFAPGRLRRDYPPQIQVSQSLSCNIDNNQHYRIGIPYQLYRCQE